MNVYYINIVFFFRLYDGEAKEPDSIEFLRSLIRNKDNKVILTVLYEAWPHTQILSILDMLEVTPKQDNVVLLMDTYTYSNPDIWKNVNVVKYDSWLCRLYHDELPPKEPNLDANKFLFIMGKPHKKQRIFPLYDLYQRNCLEGCEWSFHYHSELEDAVRPHLPNISDDEYQNFIADTTRTIDTISPVLQEDSLDFHRVAFNSTADLFSKASVSLVTETMFRRELSWFITEKTWKAVQNLHPFVLIGYKETYEYLESLGIDTFQYAVKHTHDKLVGSDEDIIKMCVDNVLYMMENKTYHMEELKSSVLHNYSVYENLALTYSEKMNPAMLDNMFWSLPYHKVKSDIALDVYEKLWGKNGADGED